MKIIWHDNLLASTGSYLYYFAQYNALHFCAKLVLYYILNWILYTGGWNPVFLLAKFLESYLLFPHTVRWNLWDLELFPSGSLNHMLMWKQPFPLYIWGLICRQMLLCLGQDWVYWKEKGAIDLQDDSLCVFLVSKTPLPPHSSSSSRNVALTFEDKNLRKCGDSSGGGLIWRPQVRTVNSIPLNITQLWIIPRTEKNVIKKLQDTAYEFKCFAKQLH